MFRITSFFIVAISFTLLFQSFFSTLYNFDPKCKIKLLNLLVYYVAGISVGIISVSFISVLTTILSIIIGFSVGNILFTFSMTIVDIDPTKLYWIIIIVCIVISLIFSRFIESIILTLVTSLLGAYCAVRGISIVLGGFPDERYLSALLTHKEFNQVSRIFAGPAFVYLTSMTMMFVFGVLFQSGALGCCSVDSEEEGKKQTLEEKI